ncbi:hypothetical protein LSAT2_009248 [Lamellibrachia satsuma]|nr:hypothetical protein LSAT2_009248 [Lamellibrachia satsuma]
MWRTYILDSFVTSNITDDFLDKIGADMEAARTAKFTLIIRFMYIDVMPDPEQAPYGDATKDVILVHIEQLAPIFTNYEDVIDVVQAGFIGVWGEWYYTTHFGPPEDRVFEDPNIDGLTPKQWNERRDVLNALLSNIPTSISVGVRTPMMKRVIYDEAGTTEAEMKTRTNKARTGHHNDAFLASSTDSGTYHCKLVEYRYKRVDTEYTVMGGETSDKSYNAPYDRYKCPTATRELKQLHYSYFSQDWNPAVLNSWREDGCYADIHLVIGYRLVLKKAILPTNMEQEGKFCFHLELENMGYAAPFKQKTLSIMLRNKTSGQLYSADLNTNVMTWLPGKTIVIDTAANTPTDIPAGTYEMLLAIKDKAAPQHSDFNILLANDNDVPERRKGLNNLKHDVTVGDIGGGAGGGCPTMTTVGAQPESNYIRTHDFTATTKTTTTTTTTTALPMLG